MDPSDTPVGRRLLDREGAAEAHMREGLSLVESLTDSQRDDIIRRIGRPLTWRLWEMAIEECARLHRPT